MSLTNDDDDIVVNMDVGVAASISVDVIVDIGMAVGMTVARISASTWS